MKNRVKKFVKDNEKVIIAGTYVAAGVVVLCIYKKMDGMKIDHGHMSDDDNTFVVHLKNGARHAFYRPGTKK